jgi:hypothetical protein
MNDTDSLYRELKNDLETVANPLFEFACQQVTKRGAFLPVGAKLTTKGKVELVAAAPEEDVTSSNIVLPLLVTALQQSASDAEAVALCEWVKIELAGAKARDAIKVHAHHKRGLAVVFYLPATKSLWRGWQFGDMVVRPADSLVEMWPVINA